MDNITTPSTGTRTVPPNVQKLADTINKSSNPQASLELLAAILKYGKTVREPKEAPPPALTSTQQEGHKVTLEKIQKYIERTPHSPLMDRYTMMTSELAALRSMAQPDLSKALCIAFCFGQAKGYRMGKAEGRSRKEARTT